MSSELDYSVNTFAALILSFTKLIVEDEQREWSLTDIRLNVLFDIVAQCQCNLFMGPGTSEHIKAPTNPQILLCINKLIAEWNILAYYYISKYHSFFKGIKMGL